MTTMRSGAWRPLGACNGVAVLAGGFAGTARPIRARQRSPLQLPAPAGMGQGSSACGIKARKGGPGMKGGSAKAVRCAIYTRVSTDQGLEQDFNSLHAQYDASQAYIRSQAHAGWTPLRGKYNDGGFSGGNTNRPALQWLLEDVRGRQNRCHRRLQGRPPDPLSGRFCQARRAVRRAQRIFQPSDFRLDFPGRKSVHAVQKRPLRPPSCSPSARPRTGLQVVGALSGAPVTEDQVVPTSAVPNRAPSHRLTAGENVGPASYAELSKKITALGNLTAQELRDEWRRLYRGQPPRVSRDLLVRAIAYRIQQLAYGGVSKATQRKLAALTRNWKRTGASFRAATVKFGQEPGSFGSGAAGRIRSS